MSLMKEEEKVAQRIKESEKEVNNYTVSYGPWSITDAETAQLLYETLHIYK